MGHSEDSRKTQPLHFYPNQDEYAAALAGHEGEYVIEDDEDEEDEEFEIEDEEEYYRRIAEGRGEYGVEDVEDYGEEGDNVSDYSDDTDQN